MDTFSAPDGTVLVEFDLRQHLAGGIVREKQFFTAMNALDWKRYTGKNVIVRACGSDPLPPWVFMLVTSKLAPHVSALYYGDVRNPLLVYGKEAE